LYGPDFSGLDQRLINSPASRIKLGKEIAARKQAKAEEEE
jgi:chorismate mutase